MVYKTYFINNRRRSKLVGTHQTKEKAIAKVGKFCKKNDFTPLYTRIMEDPQTGDTIVDVGSSMEHFRIVEVDK